VQRANVEPPKPARTAPVTAGRKGSIAFTPTATVLTQSELSDIRTLAKALENANGRIELRAYAGMRGEKTSDTRKLSLRRALVVRQELVDAGIPIETISVKALGGTDDDGPLDRVDIFAVD
jgi:outer membrane protein OmpA-like peptidoglycan-associated protein